MALKTVIKLNVDGKLSTNLYTRVGHDAVRTDGWIDGFEAGDET